LPLKSHSYKDCIAIERDKCLLAMVIITKEEKIKIYFNFDRRK